MQIQLRAGMNVARMNFSHGDHKVFAYTCVCEFEITLIPSHQHINHTNTITLTHQHINQFHLQSIVNIRKAVEQTGITCAIMLDTKGPEIRTGLLKDDKPVILQAGQSLDIISGVDDSFRGDNTVISFDYAKLASAVKPGMLIKMSDGLIVCRVEQVVDANRVRVTVTNTAELGNRKGMCQSCIIIIIPSFTHSQSMQRCQLAWCSC